MTESSNEAKTIYPDMPLCIGYISEGGTLNFITSLDSDYTSLGYLQQKFPRIIKTFKNGDWFIDHGKVMTFGQVCYIRSHKEKDSFLEVPLSEMHLFENVCGVQEKKCKVCGEKGKEDKLKKCAGCYEKGMTISYCSEKCQRKDWKKGHNKYCFSKLEESENESEKCANCGESPSQLHRCSGCYSVSYCNRECQKKHWKTHKRICC